MLMAYKTHIGLTRTINEDRVLVHHDTNGFTLAIVADGMGGHQAGDVASEMAIDIVKTELLRELQTPVSADAYEAKIKDALSVANERIFSLSTDQPQLQGMGTTVVLAVATREHVFIANVGDSRAYLYDGKALEQITEDHSLVTELVKTGQITVEESHEHPQRNVLTRALGTEPDVNVDMYELAWDDGDMLMLCSDGLTGLVNDEQLQYIFKEENEIQKQIDWLVNKALEAGGKDNITVALLSNIEHQDLNGVR